MIERIPFNPAHLDHIEVQPDQQHVIELFSNPDYIDILLVGGAHTMLHNGQIIVCAGVFPMTDYMGRAWAIVSENAGRALVAASRDIYDFLKNSEYVRIDTPVRRDFTNGHRWCKMLGFVNETPETGMKNYGFDGETYDLYAIFPKELNHGRPQPLQDKKA